MGGCPVIGLTLCLRIVALVSGVGVIIVIPISVGVIVSHVISLVVLSLALRSITLPWFFISLRSLKNKNKGSKHFKSTIKI